MDKPEQVMQEAAPSPMEQALREMLEEALTCMEGLAHEVSGCEHLNDDYFKDSICTRIRARLAALTAALPAPGDAGEYVAGYRAGIEAAAKIADLYEFQEQGHETDTEGFGTRVAGNIGFDLRAMLSAAPSPPSASISQAQAQAQAQAMREALEKIVFDWDGEPEDMADARAALAVSPPAAARPTPGESDDLSAEAAASHDAFMRDDT